MIQPSASIGQISISSSETNATRSPMVMPPLADRVRAADQHDRERDVGHQVEPRPGAGEQPGLADGGVVDEPGAGLELRRTSAGGGRTP